MKYFIDKPKSGSQKLGAYTLTEDTDSDDTSKAAGGRMFSERARLQADIPPPTAAAAVRAAARDADLKVFVFTIGNLQIANYIALISDCLSTSGKMVILCLSTSSKKVILFLRCCT